MDKYLATEKKTNIYQIKDTDGTSLDLMNILTYKDGKLDRIDTFIGRHDRAEFVSVGSAEGLSDPGAIFSYSQFTRQQEHFLLPYYIENYHNNLHGKVYHKDGGSHIVPQDDEIF